MHEAFGMAGVQQALWLQVWLETLQNLVLSSFIEIDHHISTEYCIKCRSHGPLRIKQVDTLKNQQRLKLWAHPRIPFATARPTLKKLAQALGRKLVHSVQWINAATCRIQ